MVYQPKNWSLLHLVYDLKSVGALEIKFVAPIPKQIATTTMHFPKVPGELCWKFSAQKLGINFSLFLVQGMLKKSFWGCFFPIDITCDIEKRKFGSVRPTLVIQTFDMCLLGSQFVLAWVLRTSYFGPSGHRLIHATTNYSSVGDRWWNNSMKQ